MCLCLGQADPDCTLGHILSTIYKNDPFMNKLAGYYLVDSRDDFGLHCAVVRLLYDIMPGLECALVFEESVSQTGS